MKNIITILFLFLSATIYAQIPTIKVQGGGGSTSIGVDSIWRTLGKDSILFSISGRQRSVKDSSGGSVPTLQQVFNTENGGSILTKLDTILTAGFGLRMQGTSGTSLIINNTAGTGLNITAVAGINVTAGAGAGVVASSTGTTAISGTAVSSAAIQGTSTNSFGVNAISTNGYAIHGITSTATTTFATMNLERSTAVTNTVLPVIQILRATSGTASNGIGTSMEFQTEVSDGQTFNSNTLVSKWTDATVGTRTSQFDITGINSAAVETYANFQTGSIVIVGNGADTLATNAYARSLSGGGGGNTIYTGDGAVTDPTRQVDVGSNTLQFLSTGYPNGLLQISPENLYLGDYGGGGNNTFINIQDAVGDRNIYYNAILGHTFVGNMMLNTVASGTPTDSILTRDAATGVVNMRAASSFGSGTVTSVSGTTNRITSTGGATPILDISATFEALLGKVASPLSQFAATTSAQLAGVLSDETGSGAAVFGTSPTLITPTLGVASATSLSNTGIAGAGFIQVANQSSAPSTPTTSGRIYFDNTNRFSWKGTNGFVRTLDGTGSTADRVYTLPDSSGTVALMVDSPQHVYASTIAWTGTTPPSGATNHTYKWTRVGHMVTIRINLRYATAGTALTVVTMDLPSDCPVPEIPTGYAANDYFGVGYGGMKTAHTTPFISQQRIGIKNSSPITLTCTGASNGYIDFDGVYTYWVQ